MNIDNNQEFEALCARLFPKFNEFLLRHSKNIFSCELATSLDGILTMPALYSKDGVQKQVIAPLSLLTKNVDVQIENLEKAISSANAAASYAKTTADNAAATAKKTADEAAATAKKTADEAASKANTAANNVTQTTTDLTQERKKVEEAVTASKKQNEASAASAEKATDAAKRVDEKIAQMDALAGQLSAGVTTPSRMNLTYLPEISLRNKVRQRIAAQLLPSYLPQSVLFQRAEGDSLVANPSGELTIKGEGTTKFWIIPTANTPLWQEVSITVRQPRLRLSASGKLRKAGSSLRII